MFMVFSTHLVGLDVALRRVETRKPNRLPTVEATMSAMTHRRSKG